TFIRPKGFRQLRRLIVEGRHAMTDPNALMGLLTSENLAELTSLELRGGQNPLALATASRPKRLRPPTLRSLTLAHCVTDADVEVLARLPSLHGLSYLDLSDNAVGPAGAAALAAAPWERLIDLALRGNQNLGDRGVERLASSPSLAKLTSLNLYGCNV